MEELKEKDMTPKLIGETYKKYPSETSTQKARYGLYECQYCGKHWECNSNSINSGNTKSCGCWGARRLISHGLRYNKFYSTAISMIKRCTNPNDTHYKYYGGRGITVCGEWLDVTNFVAWAEATHPNIEGLSLDRIDNDKGYSPENCRWADRSMQCVNQRMKKNNTSGYVGVCWHSRCNNWRASIDLNKVRINIGTFKTKEEAVLARDNYIVENNLPHKLSTEYRKETNE